MPPTMPRGKWALDPDPLFTKADGTALGDYDCPVLNPEDLLGDLIDHTDAERLNGCCGRDGLDGPNVLCPGCMNEIATVSDDCWTYHEARLVPTAVLAR